MLGAGTDARMMVLEGFLFPRHRCWGSPGPLGMHMCSGTRAMSPEGARALMRCAEDYNGPMGGAGSRYRIGVPKGAQVLWRGTEDCSWVPGGSMCS